jgi:hypothetical protein
LFAPFPPGVDLYRLGTILFDGKGITFAVEPKIVFPGEGSVGIENTVVVTENGYEILTPASTNIFHV